MFYKFEEFVLSFIKKEGSIISIHNTQGLVNTWCQAMRHIPKLIGRAHYICEYHSFYIKVVSSSLSG